MPGPRSTAPYSRGLGALLVAATAAAAACSDPDLSWLPANGARSAIVAVVDEAGNVELSAFNLTDGTPTHLSIDAGARRKVYALRFRRTLETLRLIPGRIELFDRGIALPTSDEPLLYSELADGTATSWSELAALPDAIAALKLRANVRCVRFGVSDFNFPGTTNEYASFAIAIDPSTAVVATATGKLFRVTRNGPERFGTLTGPREAAVRDPNSGELYLAEIGGRMVRGTFERGFVDIAPIPTSPSAVIVLAGGPGANGFELYAATNAFELWAYENEQWSLLRRDPGSTEERSRLRISWIAPGYVLAIGWGNHKLIVHEAGATTLELIPLEFRIDEDDALFEVANIEGYGAMLGTRYGQLFTRDEAKRWRVFGGAPPAHGDVSVMHGLETGIMFGGADGIMTQYYEGLGYCDPTNYAAWRIEYMIPIDDGFLTMRRAGTLDEAVPATILIRE